MTWDRVSANWRTMMRKVQQRWGRLSDSDLVNVAGRFDALVRQVQDRYALDRRQAERQVQGWLQRL